METSRHHIWSHCTTFILCLLAQHVLMEFCPIGSVKAILAKFRFTQVDPYVKYLFLWLLIEVQHKLWKRYLKIRNKM